LAFQVEDLEWYMAKLQEKEIPRYRRSYWVGEWNAVYFYWRSR